MVGSVVDVELAFVCVSWWPAGRCTPWDHWWSWSVVGRWSYCHVAPSSYRCVIWMSCLLRSNSCSLSIAVWTRTPRCPLRSSVDATPFDVSSSPSPEHEQREVPLGEWCECVFSLHFDRDPPRWRRLCAETWHRSEFLAVERARKELRSSVGSPWTSSQSLFPPHS